MKNTLPNTSQTQAQYENVLRFLPIGIGIADREGRLLFFNDAMLSPGGWENEDIVKIGNVAGLYFDENERNKALQIFMKEGQVDSFETRFKKKTGGFYYSLMSLRKIIFRGENAAMAIVQDITNIKNEEEKNKSNVKELEDTKLAMLNLLEDLENEKMVVEREKKRDEIIFSSIGSALVVTDSKGIILEVNQAFEKLTGYTAKEAIGKKMAKLIPKYDKEDNLVPESDRSITQVLKGIKPIIDVSSIITPFYFLCRDKTKLYVTGTVTPIIIESKIAGAVQVFEDITKEFELDKTKDEFLSIASHELRTPLTVIDGVISMMRSGEYGQLSPEMKKGLDDVNGSSERLIGLVNDLLSLSRMQAGRLKYTLTTFYVDKLLQDEANLFTDVLKGKGLTIKTKLLPHFQVQADTDKVKQVLNNLFGNSLKFTDKGGLTISGSQDKDFVVIEITDTGCGITKKDQGKLFGKFQQVGDKSHGQGTGLGLHISREIIRKMGGDLWLKSSEVGKGSTFSFSLPKVGSEPAIKSQQLITKEARLHPDQKSDIIKKG